MKTKETTFTCATCKKVLPVSTEGGTGYGTARCRMTSNAKHTAGPWKAYNAIGGHTLNSWRVATDTKPDRAICVVSDLNDQDAGNARLIASAPELEEKLQRLYKQSLAMCDLRHNNAEIDDEEWSKLYNLTMDARGLIDRIAEGRAE